MTHTVLSTVEMVRSPPALNRREEQIVRVAIGPRFAHFTRSDDGVLRVPCGGAGVPIGRGIAATDVAARQADAQVHPVAADFQTVLAARLRATDRARRLFRDVPA